MMNHEEEEMLNLTPLSNSHNAIAKTESSGSNNNANMSLNSGGCRLKGVVPQQNGHWGAQIYTKHTRIWLGTFKTEVAAAMAYDSAALKLKPEKDNAGEHTRNLDASPAMLAIESRFQSHFSADEVLLMIKDGSYPSKMAEYCRTCQRHPEAGVRAGVINGGFGNSFVYTHSFEKELTPSDVGKLNRLVIPKKFAVKFFPKVKEAKEEGSFTTVGLASVEDCELEFFDKTMRRWSFRYCYWRSSQSFVFTKGWNKFVKEKGLKNKDVVIFYRCLVGSEVVRFGGRTSFSLIDVRHGPPQLEGVGVDPNGEGPSEVAEEEEEEMNEGEEEEEEEEEEENMEVEEERKVVKLFGVEIQ